MKKGLVFGAALLFASTPAFAETTAWGGVSAGLNLDGGDVSIIGRVGVDTSIGKGAFVGLGIGAGESGLKDCLGINCVKGGRELSAEVRLGAVTNGGTKIYAIGGYSNLSVNVANAFSYTDGGITGGAGVEFPLSSKLFWRSEFRYTNYGDGDHVTSIMPTIGFRF